MLGTCREGRRRDSNFRKRSRHGTENRRPVDQRSAHGHLRKARQGEAWGGLQIRKGAAGAVTFYWRYSIGASSERVLIGLYGPFENRWRPAGVRSHTASLSEHLRKRRQHGLGPLAVHQFGQAVVAVQSVHRSEQSTEQTSQFGRVLDRELAAIAFDGHHLDVR